VPAKAGKCQFAGATAPLSVSGFACAANSTPREKGFAPPPAQGRHPPPNLAISVDPPKNQSRSKRLI